MPARPSYGVVCLAALALLSAPAALPGCSAADSDVDPGALELRDLLGLSPEAATAWTTEHRLAARRVLETGLVDDITVSIAETAEHCPAETAEHRLAETTEHRLAARRVLETGLADGLDERVAALLASVDDARAADGTAPLGIVAIDLDSLDSLDSHDSISDSSLPPATTTPDRDRSARPRAAVVSRVGLRTAVLLREPPISTAPGASPASAHPLELTPPDAGPRVELWLGERWDTGQSWSQLPGRGAALLAALALDAGHPGGPVVVVPAPRLAVIAAYVRPGGAAPPRLLVNPVALAALEPAPGDAAAVAAMVRVAPAPATSQLGQLRGAQPVTGATTVASTGGNPYSFYGSVAECAAAQRSRCDACLPAGSCRPITNIADGNTECTMLGDDGGRGYFLLCINLSLAITSIDRCTGDAAPACVRDPHAADSLATLDNNADFLSDPTCGDALDGCLARIFGPPDGSFPGLDAGLDAGTVTPPARSTSVTCSNSCSNDKNVTCNASPSCDCSGPSCNNSLSCDSACSSSNDQGGCGGNCNACGSSGGGGGNGGGGCGGDSSSSGGGCGNSSGSSNSGCGNSCSSSSGNSSCGGGGCSSGSNSSSCGGSSGGGKCTAATIDPAPGIGLAMSVLWGTLPIALATFTRRRARRRASPGLAPPTDAHVGAHSRSPRAIDPPPIDRVEPHAHVGAHSRSPRAIDPPPIDHVEPHAHVGAHTRSPRAIDPPPIDHVEPHAHVDASTEPGREPAGEAAREPGRDSGHERVATTGGETDDAAAVCAQEGAP